MVSGPNCQSADCRAPTALSALAMPPSGKGRSMPLGLPVVPELYSMKVPAGSSLSGSAGCSASVAS